VGFSLKLKEDFSQLKRKPILEPSETLKTRKVVQDTITLQTMILNEIITQVWKKSNFIVTKDLNIKESLKNTSTLFENTKIRAN